MKNYIYEPMWTQELEDALEASPEKPLVIELFYKYGLKVFDITNVSKLKSYGTTHGFCMTIDGPNYGIAFVEYDTENNNILYCYRTPNNKKLRGRTEADKETTFSKKLSSLMKSLDKNANVPQAPYGFIPAYDLERSIEMARNSIPAPDDVTGLPKGTLPRLVGHILDDNTFGSMTQADFDNCRKVIGELKQAEGIKEKRRNITRSYLKPFYVIGVDTNKGYVIAKCVLNKTTDNKLDYKNIDYIVPTQRVKAVEEFDDYENFRGLWTMVKIAFEGNASRKEKGIPVADAWYDVGATTYYNGYPAEFRCFWATIPTELPTGE